jgi:hypothetical protein
MARAPKAFKDAFSHWVEGWGWTDKDRIILPYKELIFDVGRNREQVGLMELLGKLWQCTDKMPGDIAERIGLEPGSNYAQAAQMIHSHARSRGRFIIPRGGYRVPPS